jgi:hypothetical protein
MGQQDRHFPAVAKNKYSFHILTDDAAATIVIWQELLIARERKRRLKSQMNGN